MRSGGLRRCDPAKPTRPDAESPDLQTFLAQDDPDGFYGEADLLDLSAAAFPAPDGIWANRRVTRTGRLRKRQTAVLTRLDATQAEAPQPGHTRDTWLEPARGQRLGAARLAMFADLLALVSRYRRR